MEKSTMTRICPTCKQLFYYTEDKVTRTKVNKCYPFMNLVHVYEVEYLECPNCKTTFELRRALIEAQKNGKPLHPPIH